MQEILRYTILDSSKLKVIHISDVLHSTVARAQVHTDMCDVDELTRL